MSLLLLLIASLMKWLLSPFLFIYGVIASSFKKERSQYLKDLAIAKDQYGNAVGKYVFNHCLITDDGYKFGNIDETISSVVGKNKVKGTLNKSGKLLDYLLELAEKDHSIKSIDETE